MNIPLINDLLILISSKETIYPSRL